MMSKQFPEVDVVIVGMGWTGGILSKELSESGLKVVALERGAPRSAEEDFSIVDSSGFSTPADTGFSTSAANLTATLLSFAIINYLLSNLIHCSVSSRNNINSGLSSDKAS